MVREAEVYRPRGQAQHQRGRNRLRYLQVILISGVQPDRSVSALAGYAAYLIPDIRSWHDLDFSIRPGLILD